jgi:hypothetical protein
MKFYIFGIQRTCTNLAKATIEYNFWSKNGNVNDSGHWAWKHNSDAEQATANLAQSTPVIFCYKKPLSWIKSIIDNEVDFINKYRLTRYPDYIDEDLIIKNSMFSWSLPNALEIWIQFHIDWIKYLHRCNYVIMQQDKMIEQPSVIDILSRVQYKLELVKKMPSWTIIDKYVGRGARIQDKPYVSKNISLTEKQIDYINKKIPKEIITFFENE